MYLIFHGGKCCAIRTIHSFGNDPNEMMSERAPAIQADRWPDTGGGPVHSYYELPYGKRPYESRLERLKFFISYLKSHRPGGLVEVALACMPYTEDNFDNWDEDDKVEWCEEECDQRLWFPHLEELGFRRVQKFINSNSDNEIHLFHLLMQGGEIVEQEFVK